MEADPLTPDAAIISSSPADAAAVTSSLPENAAGTAPVLDLDAITADFDGVEAALTRLGDGTYWTDEITGEPLPDELLAASPTARHA